MSTRSRGNAFEKKVIEHWTGRGWLCERALAKLVAIGPGRFITQAHDFYGCFDFIGLHPKAMQVALIQVTIGEASHRMAKIVAKLDEFKFNPEVHLVQVWKRQEADKQRVRIQTLVGGDPGYTWQESLVSFKDGIPDSVIGLEP